MWLEDSRLDNNYPQWKCKPCYYARTCEESARWKLCQTFQYFDWEEKDKEDKKEWKTYRNWGIKNK